MRCTMVVGESVPRVSASREADNSVRPIGFETWMVVSVSEARWGFRLTAESLCLDISRS